MKEVFKIFMAIVIAASVLISCEREHQEFIHNHEFNSLVSNPKEAFASALSKAVVAHAELRSFIKDEAVKQFDKDYDVFYPFVKNKVVSGNKTFRDYILEYMPDTELLEIEKALPLLNVLVPDWEWIGAFSVNTWNPNDESIIVGYSDRESIKHPIIYNGDVVDTLMAGEFPSIPTLIIKENERMKVVSTGTRGYDCEYDYVDEAFKPKSKVRINKVSVETKYYTYEAHPGSEYVDTAVFKQDFPYAVEAWKEYGADVYEAQRKFVYFDLRKGETEGRINPKVQESIVAFKLIDTNCMDVKKIDSKLKDYQQDDAISQNDTTLLMNVIWNSGQLEIKFVASTIDSSGNRRELASNAQSVHAKNLFDLTLLRRDYHHKTWFDHHSYYVYIAEYKDLVPKWYYLEKPLEFDRWHPEIESGIIDIHVYEYDQSKETTVTENIKHSGPISISAGVGGKFNFSFNFGGETSEKTCTYTIHEDSDDLGRKEMYFDDFIISAEENGKYKLKTYTTGKIEYIIVPKVSK